MDDNELYDQAMSTIHGKQVEEKEEERALAVSEPIPESPREPSPWDQVMAEWKAPIEQRMLLVRTMGRITVPLVEQVTEAAERYGLPIAGINLIPNKKTGIDSIYVNSEGIRWRLHVDKRGFKGSGGTITHMPTETEHWITAHARVEMENGAWAENESVKEWPVADPGDKDRSFDLGNMCKKLITQAKRRAGADLVGVGLPIYDEYYENVVEGNFSVIEEPEAKKLAAPAVPNSIPSLLTMAQELDSRWDMDSLAELLGVSSIFAGDIDIENAWRKVIEYGEEGKVSDTDKAAKE
jgi:hypothetical protein